MMEYQKNHQATSYHHIITIIMLADPIKETAYNAVLYKKVKPMSTMDYTLEDYTHLKSR